MNGCWVSGGAGFAGKDKIAGDWCGKLGPVAGSAARCEAGVGTKGEGIPLPAGGNDSGRVGEGGAEHGTENFEGASGQVLIRHGFRAFGKGTGIEAEEDGLPIDRDKVDPFFPPAVAYETKKVGFFGPGNLGEAEEKLVEGAEAEAADGVAMGFGEVRNEADPAGFEDAEGQGHEGGLCFEAGLIGVGDHVFIRPFNLGDRLAEMGFGGLAKGVEEGGIAAGEKEITAELIGPVVIEGKGELRGVGGVFDGDRGVDRIAGTGSRGFGQGGDGGVDGPSQGIGRFG